MKASEARVWIIKYSLLTTILTFAFFVLAPPLGYPLSTDQAMRILEIITPVFLGYIGAGAQYFTANRVETTQPAGDPPAKREGDLFNLMVKGPIFGFSAILLIAVVAFYISNRPAAPFGHGMTIENLALVITGALGLLTVSTNALIAILFHSELKHAQT